MSGWIRDPNSKNLNRIKTHLDNSESEPKIEDNKIGEGRTLNGIFYQSRTTALSCFNIPALENVALELKPQYTHMLPNFTDVEDAYLFL